MAPTAASPDHVSSMRKIGASGARFPNRGNQGNPKPAMPRLQKPVENAFLVHVISQLFSNWNECDGSSKRWLECDFHCKTLPFV